MKYRLLVIANIGIILGIITAVCFKELYLRKSIILFLSIFVIIFILIYIIQKIFKNSKKKYVIRPILKSFLDVKEIFIIFFILGFLLLIIKDTKYETFYNDMYALNNKKICVHAIVVENKEESEYNETYKIKILDINNKKYFNTYCFIKLKKQQEKEIHYADLIYFEGEFEEPIDSSNYKGFSYKEYLKTVNVYGSFKTTYNKVKVLKEEYLGTIYILANKVKRSFERSN